MRVFLAVLLAMIVSASAYAQPAHPAFTSGTLTAGNCAKFGTGSQAGTLVDSAVPGCTSGPAVFNGTGDWQYVVNSATGTGTDNFTALNAAFNACDKNGTTNLYIPPGKYFISANITFGTCDTNIVMAAGAQIVCPLTITCFRWGPPTVTQMPIAGIIEGYASTMANGFAPSTGGSGCEVGDILTPRADINEYARTARHRALFQVATCSGAAVATMNVLYAGNYLANPGNGSAVVMQTVSGTTTGVIVNNLTWTTPPGFFGQMATELVLPGTNATTENNSCVVTDAGPTMCIGDAVKLISNQQAPWLYSGAQQSVGIVQDTGDWTYGPIVAAGGTGYTVGDVLTLLTLTSPVAKNAQGIGVQLLATTPATVTVASVTATGAITGLTVTTKGTYDHINYRAIPLTGGTGTGASAFFNYKVTLGSVAANLGVTYANMATVAQVIDATHILLSGVTLFPHAFDAVNPPILIAMPKTKLITDNLTCRASGQIHNASYTNRVPSCIDIDGAVYPKVDVRCVGEWSICLEEFSVWHGDFTLICEDAVDMPTQAGTGYCVNSLGASKGSRFKMIVNDVRHGFGSGTYTGKTYADLAGFWWAMGGSEDTLVYDSMCTDAHVACYDTHQDGYNARFANDWAESGLADPHSGSGTVSIAFDIRGYKNTVTGGGSHGNMRCVIDSTQEPDFGGVFSSDSISHVKGLLCDASPFAVSSNVSIGYATTSSGTTGTPTNTHSAGAITMVENSSFDGFSAITDLNVQVNRFVFNADTFTDFNYFCGCASPVDVAVSNSVFDNTSHVAGNVLSGGVGLFNRAATTFVTGTQEFLLTNNTFKNSRTPIGGNFPYPTTFFSHKSANALDTAYLEYGGNQIVGSAFGVINTTAGAPIVYVSTAYDPNGGIAYKRITLPAVSMAATGDQGIIPIPPSIRRYRVFAAEVANCSTSAAAGLAGLWSGVGKTGINWAANQALTTATGSTTVQGLTLTAAAASNDTLTTVSPNIYFNVGTSVASPTCNVTVVLADTTNQ